jgi:hypothetical protein
MPRFAAADVSFSPFCGKKRYGPGGGWKNLEKGFKMVSHWPQWTKNNLKGVLGTKG